MPDKRVVEKKTVAIATHVPLVPSEGVCNIQNFNFESGQRISELRIHYSTLGTPQYDGEGFICNAVLLLHPASANRTLWWSGLLGLELYGPGQPLDISRYFIVIPDLLGHGQSSKPSDGLRMQFPHYQCRDIVNSAHLLVAQGLGIRQLQLVIGASLGAMLVWLWGQMYPESSVRLMPIGAYPMALGGRNWIASRMGIDAIRQDPTWQEGNYTEQPTYHLHAAPLFLLLAHSAQQFQDVAPNMEAADRYYDQLIKIAAQNDANDLLYAFEATRIYDPSPGLEKITAKVLAINFSDDAIWPPETNEVGAALARLPNTRFVLVPATRQSCGHLSYFQPAMWKAHLAEFLA